MSKKWRVIAAIIGVFTLGFVTPTAAYAHGVNIEYTSDVEIEVVAEYDSGEPMAGAQVAVYAPDDPTTPWLTGVCDDQGRFSFTPDTSRPGTWDVQVRLAGHGGMIHIPIGEDTASTGGIGGYTNLQIGLMAACVVWGSVGTTLYFSRRRNT